MLGGGHDGLADDPVDLDPTCHEKHASSVSSAITEPDIVGVRTVQDAISWRFVIRPRTTVKPAFLLYAMLPA